MEMEAPAQSRATAVGGEPVSQLPAPCSSTASALAQWGDTEADAVAGGDK